MNKLEKILHYKKCWGEGKGLRVILIERKRKSRKVKNRNKMRKKAKLRRTAL